MVDVGIELALDVASSDYFLDFSSSEYNILDTTSHDTITQTASAYDDEDHVSIINDRVQQQRDLSSVPIQAPNHNHKNVKAKPHLRTMYDTVDNVDHTHDLSNLNVEPHIDAPHQHTIEIVEDEPRRPKRFAPNESEESRQRRKQSNLLKSPPSLSSSSSSSWSLKSTYLFLLTLNLLMLTSYTVKDFLDFIPAAVWYFVVCIHISAIGLFVYDTIVTYFPRVKGNSVHSV